MTEKRNPAAFPKVGDILITKSEIGLEIVTIDANANENMQIVYRSFEGWTSSTSILGWARAILDAKEVRLAEDNQPAVPQEPECTCVSLLFGHETKCPMWRKI